MALLFFHQDALIDTAGGLENLMHIFAKGVKKV
jgi:hypothetical protein